jgi:ATP-binding cassette subfamily F protein 3
MDGNFTVYDTLDRVAVGDIRTRLRDILAAFLFRGDDIDKKVKVLSGGERSRLAMARLMLEPYNLLVLDEPTNHMDMRSKDILKRALMRYDGTVVVVSHDREFLDGLIDKVYEFRDGGVREYLGDIWYFLEKRKLESLREVEARRESISVNDQTANKPVRATTPGTQAASPSSVSTPLAPKPTGRGDYERKKEAEKEIRRVERAIAETEKRVAALETDIAGWDKRLSNPAVHGIDLSDAGVFTAYNELKSRLSHEMHEWEKLHYELEILTDSGGTE